MKTKELRTLSDGEIIQKISDFKKEMFNLRFQQATGKSIANNKRVLFLRRSVARALTLLNERKRREKE